MSNKAYTTQKGFYTLILKSLESLNSPQSLKNIIEFINTNNSFVPNEGDLDVIDFNGKVHFEYTIEHALEALVKQDFVLLQGDGYSITQAGIQKVQDEWPNYKQQDYIKKIDLSDKNKFIYNNMPPHLLNIGHKKTTVYGFVGFDLKYVKLLNDFLDYIDLNYPTIEEMVNFLSHNYNFSSNSVSLNAINVTRSCSLTKIIGKNISLTKLGQWYINNYNNIALFRIFSGIYTGFEEIFITVATNHEISVQNLERILADKYYFDWTDTKQFDIRLNWLENLKIISTNDSIVSLANDAIELAEFLGILPYEDQYDAPQIIISQFSSSNDADNEIEPDFEQIDEIIDDLISESNLFEDTFEQDDLIMDFNETDEVIEKKAELLSQKENFEKTITLSQQERNYLLNNVDFESTMFNTQEIYSEEISADNDFTDLAQYVIENAPNDGSVILDSSNKNIDKLECITQAEEKVQQIIEEKNEIEINEIDNKKTSRIIQIGKRKGNFEEVIYKENQSPTFDFNITADEISNLVNLPNNIISKITSALNMGKHIILTGPHGSGKTSLAVILSKLAHKKSLNNGYNLTSANDSWSSLDTIGGLIDIDNESQKFFKEGFILKSIRENKWLIIDEITKCDTSKCFNDFINAFYDHNTILSYMHQNYKNIEILSEPTQENYEANQYVKNKNWRMIATMDTHEKQHINFSGDFIRRFAFIEIGVNNYSGLIDKYFVQNNLQNDLLKTKIKNIFSSNGILKYKEFGSSSIHDLIHYISIRSNLLSEDENIQDILAEGLELYILPQLQILDNKVIKEVETYFLELFDGYENIKKSISNIL